MKHLLKRAFFCLSAFLCLTSWSPAHSADSEAEPDKMGSGPVVIHSNKLEADDKAKTITFWGDVTAKRDDFAIDCREMVVYLRKKSLQTQEEGKASPRIDRIVATGDVKIVRSAGGTATAQKAVYYQEEEKIVLTGEPIVKQGNDFVAGDRITLFIAEDRSVVDSPQNGKVKAVIFPKEETGK
ncbi:MAG: lipopolysaccharide transport periplasmic protein LptA [Deltaproteobacteria bacterium]|nr:lipopolysaccharide transport periplasmic protein LptA [Deltaproteobacteria bacterium]